MDTMKQKLYIAGFIALLVMVGVAIFMLSKGPAQAVDPSKDYSKAAKPSTSVLSDSVDQGQPKTAAAAASNPTASKSVPTASTTPAANQPAAATQTTTASSTTSTAGDDTTIGSGGTESESESGKHGGSRHSDTEGAVEAVLQSLSNLGL